MFGTGDEFVSVLAVDKLPLTLEFSRSWNGRKNERLQREM
jgi:hypothetical protein